MGKFACYCGYVISDSTYPCPLSGELKWETESELQSQETMRDVKEFFAAIENKKDSDWIRNYFGEEYLEIYPVNISVGEVIDDIYTKNSSKKGHMVYQCPECERLYLQKEFYTDEWICYEKAK